MIRPEIDWRLAAGPTPKERELLEELAAVLDELRELHAGLVARADRVAACGPRAGGPAQPRGSRERCAWDRMT